MLYPPSKKCTSSTGLETGCKPVLLILKHPKSGQFSTQNLNGKGIKKPEQESGLRFICAISIRLLSNGSKLSDAIQKVDVDELETLSPFKNRSYPVLRFHCIYSFECWDSLFETLS